MTAGLIFAADRRRGGRFAARREAGSAPEQALQRIGDFLADLFVELFAELFLGLLLQFLEADGGRLAEHAALVTSAREALENGADIVELDFEPLH